MNDQPLSDEELKLAVDSLSKLEPGFLPLPIFHQVTRLTATPIIEIVPLRRAVDGIEILLLKREEDDPVWPGALHVPGTVIRATDTMESAFDRILSGELNGVLSSKPTFVKNVLHHSGRGLESSQVYWIDVSGEPSTGQFCSVDDLPDTLVESQLDFISAAIENYRG